MYRVVNLTRARLFLNAVLGEHFLAWFVLGNVLIKAMHTNGEQPKQQARRCWMIMSEGVALPPAVQERLMRLQQLQQTLQSVLTQKQQVELELLEVDQALGELEKTADDGVIYKSVGSLLIKSEKPKVTDELKEKKELSNMRVSVLGKQEERLRTQIKDLNDRLQKDLRPLSST